MNLLGNIVWLLLGGLAVAVEYFVSGLALCLTIDPATRHFDEYAQDNLT